MMEEVGSEDHVGEVTNQMAETKIADQLQDAACTDVTQGIQPTFLMPSAGFLLGCLVFCTKQTN